MLNCGQNGRRRLGRYLKRLLYEVETGLLGAWLVTDDYNDDNFLYKFVWNISHSKKNWANYEIMETNYEEAVFAIIFDVL